MLTFFASQIAPASFKPTCEAIEQARGEKSCVSIGAFSDEREAGIARQIGAHPAGLVSVGDGESRLCCANRAEVEPLLIPSVSCNALRRRRAGAGAAVEEGGADVGLCGLRVDGAGRETVTETLEAPHLGSDPTSSAIAAPGAPDRSPEVTGDPEDVVASLDSGSGLLPNPTVAAGGE